MPQSERVSVIIPNFNHARYLGDAIQSVLNQTYRPVEVIVVDDGSTDDSRAVAARFGEQVTTIWQENQGLSAARNTGLAAATGSLIALLDADDLFEPDFLSTLVTIIANDPAIAGVHCGYRFVDHRNRPLPQVEARDVAPGQLYHDLLASNFLVPESMLLRRRCYEEAGLFDTSLRACEDWDMWLRIASQHNIACSTAVLTLHRILPGSMSTDPRRMLDSRLAVLRKHVGEQPDSEEAAFAYGRAYLASCVEYLQAGNTVEATTCLRNMARVFPQLLKQADTFYQLGCGSQPKGQLGDFNALDLPRNARVLLHMLDELFADADLAEGLRPYRRSAYAQAYAALAYLNYGARDLTTARRLFFRALQTEPVIAFNRQFATTLPKTLLGKTLLVQLERIKHKPA